MGDPDRAAADAELQAAVGRGALSLGDYEDLARSVWGARTRGELTAVTADLVVELTVAASALMGSVTVSHDSTGAAAGAGRGVDLEKHHGRVDRRRPHRSGGWSPKRIVTVVAVAAAAYGAVHVAGADHPTVLGSDTVTQTGSGTVDVGVLFGTARVVVPDNAVVTKDNSVIFGSTTCDTACTPGRTGGPTITVKGAGAFGSVQVATVTEAAADRSNR